jgi:hypothetical protein
MQSMFASPEWYNPEYESFFLTNSKASPKN